MAATIQARLDAESQKIMDKLLKSTGWTPSRVVREGLRLLWHSRLEKKFNDDPPRETVISPLVTALSYDYYDSNFKNWKNETQLRRDAQNAVLTPQRLRLKFAYGKLTRETIITLPVPTETPPNF